MRRQLLLASLAAVSGACDEGDLHRIAGVSQGRLVVGLGMPMSDVARRSTVKLHKLPTLGLPNGNYADGNAYFDFELAGSSVRFRGCSMYSIDYEGRGEIVTQVNVTLTPRRHRWAALQRELRDAAAKLKHDGWEPYAHDGLPTLESFLAQDASKIETTASGRIASFEWKKGAAIASLSADRAWDGPEFWSSLVVASDTRKDWLAEFPSYPGASRVCAGHVLGSSDGKRREIEFSLYATKDDPAAVVGFYASAHRAKAQSGDTTLIVRSTDGKKALSVRAVSDSYPDCGVKAAKDAKTVIVVSQMTP